MNWYKTNCDGDWEHSYGIKLQTLDNPGWHLTVDLHETTLDGLTMQTIEEGCDPDESIWIHCQVLNNQFSASCNPDQLTRLFDEFALFLDSAKNQSNETKPNA